MNIRSARSVRAKISISAVFETNANVPLHKDCNNTFNAFSKRPLARSQHPETWNRESMTQSTSSRPIANTCGITLKTSFNWRHRFPRVLKNNHQMSLERSSNWMKHFSVSPSRARKKICHDLLVTRWGEKDDCRKIPVMVARDGSKRTVDGVLETGSRRTLPLFEMPYPRPEGRAIKTRLIYFASIPR